MSIHELRDLGEARKFILQGLMLQRRLTPPRPSVVHSALQWAYEIASSGEPLPPVGFVADVGVEVFDIARGEKPTQTPSAPGGLPATVARNYEDYVLGKFYADWTIERAKDALRRYVAEREQARGLAFLINQFRRRADFDGVLLSPSIIRALLEMTPEEALRRGQESLLSDGLMPLLETCYASIVDAARRTGEILNEADVLALENRVALADESQRIAHDQVVSAKIELRNALPRHRVKPLAGRHEVPTRVLDEDTYPVGGFTSISTRGSVESLLHSQLAYMEDETRPDLFDVKYVRDELYYYARDENQFLRRRRSFVFALYPDLAQTRFKDPESKYQRIVYLLGFMLAAVEKLTGWLSTDALQFHFVFLTAEDSLPLRHEYELLQMLLREMIENGTVHLHPNNALSGKPTPVDLEELSRVGAQRSLCHLLTLSIADQPQQIAETAVARLSLAEAQPALAHGEIEPTAMEWPAALEKLLQLWV